MTFIREQFEFENTYVRELLYIWKPHQKHSKIDSSVNNQKSKIYKHTLSKVWK